MGDSLPASFTIGSSAENLFQIDHHLVAEKHVLIMKLDDGSFLVRDISQTSILLVNRQTVSVARVDKTRKLCLGSEKVSFCIKDIEKALEQGRKDLTSNFSKKNVHYYKLEPSRRYSLGANPQCDIQLNSPTLDWLAGSISFDKSWQISMNDRPSKTLSEKTIRIDRYDFSLDASNNELEVCVAENDVLQTKALSVKTESGRSILHDINLKLHSGSFVGIIGPSGAGKSTLMKVLCGLKEPSEGKLHLNGRSLLKNQTLSRKLKYVPQFDVVQDYLTVLENIEYASKLRLPISWPNEALTKRALEIVQMVGLTHVVNHRANVISGGQRQRVNLAMEMVLEPKFLFADECCSGLSAGDTSKIMQVFRTLADNGTGVVLTIHTPDIESLAMMDYLLVLDTGGYMAYYGPSQPDAIEYFTEKRISPHHSPKVIFDILEMTDENDISKRLIEPQQWYERFKSSEYYQRYVEKTHSNQ
ncbi:ATP-binding cassette domain-containing protein [Alteromonas sp. ASW11-36]|uniref:ATP-binding cassette domain-containing protein n=1 Tax=Alteromonas arenosi TaxID=3055817 RepID=A0ABT7SW98_9ALTE|nr:ATP-binding cassette domain-containing protein [Alteromonas sp. ASW11-36]MDM7860450.1 ATP-binding cassette domain-containing protein [Alteromonas sp. ASW11-36]